MPLTQNIGLEQLTQYFHLPINAVAKELGICATVLKKICRKNGIPRWPHRKIKSLDKMIGSLQAISPKSPEDEERIKQEIESLVNKKRYLITNPTSLVKIKKAHPSKAAPKGSKRKPSKQEEAPEGDENELSPAFLDADILDLDGFAAWHAPPFTDSDLASVPHDSPLGRALLMKPCPLDQLPRVVPPAVVSMPSAVGGRPHSAMPSGGPSGFPAFLPHAARASAFSTKLPEIGALEGEPDSVDAAATLGSGATLKLDVLEPNVLHPSINPLPFTTQYGIHPITQTLQQQLEQQHQLHHHHHHHLQQQQQQHSIGVDWRENLPPWYADEFGLARPLLALPADIVAPSLLAAASTTSTTATTTTISSSPLAGSAMGDAYADGDDVEDEDDENPEDSAATIGSGSDDVEGSDAAPHPFLIAEGVPVVLDGSDASIFDHLL